MQYRLARAITMSLIASAVISAVSFGQISDSQSAREPVSSQPKMIGYFCGSNGHLLSQIADSPYTHIIIAFVASDKDSGELEFVCGESLKRSLILSDSVSKGIRNLQSKGIKVLLSFGGGTMRSENYAAWSNWVPGLAEKLAHIVRNSPTKDGIPIRFDGLDIDWEDTSAFTTQAIYDGRKFLIELTKELRKTKNLPSSEGFLLTHTPQPPYLANHHTGMNGYVDVWNEVGDQIDWLQMQYYNNPGYQSAQQLLAHYRATINGWPQRGKRPPFAGIPSHKLIVGKPILQKDAGSGYVPVAHLIRETITPLKNEYGDRFGGIFAWQIAQDENGEWGEQIAEALFD